MNPILKLGSLERLTRGRPEDSLLESLDEFLLRNEVVELASATYYKSANLGTKAVEASYVYLSGASDSRIYLSDDQDLLIGQGQLPGELARQIEPTQLELRKLEALERIADRGNLKIGLVARELRHIRFFRDLKHMKGKNFIILTEP